MDKHQEDLILIEKVLRGDESQFRTLVEKHQDYAYTIAYKILNNNQDAEEASQDAFIKAFHALKNFNREAKFTTWFYRIVFNTAVTYKRKQRHDVSDIDNLRDMAGADSAGNLQSDERRKYINEGISQLLPADATVITLFYLKEFSLEEISEITGMKINAIKIKLFRARKRLADRMTRILSTETKSLYG